MRCQQGFTLTELMVGLAVMGLTLGIGVPEFSDFVANQTQTSATNDLVTAMTLARSEAIKQNRYVTVCKSDDGLRCGARGGWESGWIVFANTSQLNAATVDPGETVIKAFERNDDKRKITTSVAGLNFVAFRPTGTVTANATWVLCDKRGDVHAKAVAVDRAGRARTVTPEPPPVAGNPDDDPAPSPGICG